MVLTELDKKRITNFITNYAPAPGYPAPDTEMASLDEILSVWRKEKAPLYDKMGSLILKKEVSFVDEDKRQDKIWNYMHSPLWKEFYDTLCNELNRPEIDKFFNLSPFYQMWNYTSNKYSHMFNIGIIDLVKNLYDGEEFEFESLLTGKTIKIKRGIKIFKMFLKIIKHLKFDENRELMRAFEAARIEHSKAVEVKEDKGTLCLSIHPLDYMTMSSNSSNWSSCMRWNGEYGDAGEYRGGTVEMMNSGNVVICYLEDKRNYCFGIWSSEETDEWTWNSKKWRELFIVDEDILSAVKAYPYASDNLENECLNWIKEIFADKEEEYSEIVKTKTLTGSDFSPGFSYEGTRFTYSTNIMYRDGIGSFIARKVQPSDSKKINYSGPFNCMWCGEKSYPEDDRTVLCSACNTGSGAYYCDNCGTNLFEDEVYWGSHDEALCDYCYGEIYAYDELLQYDVEREDTFELIFTHVDENNDTRYISIWRTSVPPKELVEEYELNPDRLYENETGDEVVYLFSSSEDIPKRFIREWDFKKFFEEGYFLLYCRNDAPLTKLLEDFKKIDF